MSETNDTSYGTAARSEHELTIDELDAVSGGDVPTLSNVSKTRSEIIMTFARNSHA